MQAKALNSSSYPLLASDKVSIFLDGNYISTSSLPQTSSGEYFTIFVGVDPAVKADYMPCRSVNRVRGWLSGTEEKKVFHATMIHNTKQFPCRILIAEPFPRSPDEKIAVDLLEPSPALLARQNQDAPPTSTDQEIVSNLSSYGLEMTGNQQSFSWPRDFVTLNKYTNNLVWLKTIQPGEKIEIKFVYKVSWPQGRQIQFE